ncbi:MAG: hypothetical protein QOG76_5157, partial [Pseudonocardiales bacterium]|nr:hypothetical protein [Pseudonocardiales bacterium]
LGLENDDPQTLAGQRQRGNEPDRTGSDDHTPIAILWLVRHGDDPRGWLVTAAQMPVSG